MAVYNPHISRDNSRFYMGYKYKCNRVQYVYGTNIIQIRYVFSIKTGWYGQINRHVSTGSHHSIIGRRFLNSQGLNAGYIAAVVAKSAVIGVQLDPEFSQFCFFFFIVAVARYQAPHSMVSISLRCDAIALRCFISLYYCTTTLCLQYSFPCFRTPWQAAAVTLYQKQGAKDCRRQHSKFLSMYSDLHHHQSSFVVIILIHVAELVPSCRCLFFRWP